MKKIIYKPYVEWNRHDGVENNNVGEKDKQRNYCCTSTDWGGLIGLRLTVTTRNNAFPRQVNLKCVAYFCLPHSTTDAADRAYAQKEDKYLKEMWKYLELNKTIEMVWWLYNCFITLVRERALDAII